MSRDEQRQGCARRGLIDQTRNALNRQAFDSIGATQESGRREKDHRPAHQLFSFARSGDQRRLQGKDRGSADITSGPRK